MYAIMYRTSYGVNHMMKESYRTLDDAESGVLDSFPWLTGDRWARGNNSSIFNLSDGSCFVIYRES